MKKVIVFLAWEDSRVPGTKGIETFHSFKKTQPKSAPLYKLSAVSSSVRYLMISIEKRAAVPGPRLVIRLPSVTTDSSRYVASSGKYF